MRIWPSGKRWRGYLRVIIALVLTPIVGAVTFLVFQPAAPPDRDYEREYERLIDSIIPENAVSWRARYNWEVIAGLANSLYYDAEEALLAMPEWNQSEDHEWAASRAGYDPMYLTDPVPELDPRDPQARLEWLASRDFTRIETEFYIASRIPERLEGLGCRPLVRPPEQSGPIISMANRDLNAARKTAVLEQMRIAYMGDALPLDEPVRNVLTVANIAENDPMVVAFLVAAGIRVIAYEMVIDALRSGELSAGECAALSRVVEDCWPATHDYVSTIEHGRLMGLDAFQRIYTGDRAIDSKYSAGSPVLWFVRGTHRARHDAMNDFSDALLALASLSPSDRWTGGEPHLRTIRARADEQSTIAVLANAAPSWLSRMDADTAHRDALRIMLAIERYRLAHGAPPGGLDALVPDYLCELPGDRYAADGRFRYARAAPSDEASGLPYVLYSVGFDGQDDGGRQRAEFPGGELIAPSGWDLTQPYNPPPAGSGVDRVFTAAEPG